MTVTIWLAILSLAVLLITRQLGLIALRLQSSGTLAEDGVMIGTPVPRGALDEVPPLSVGLHYLLFLAPNCGPCVDFAHELRRQQFSHGDVTAVLANGEGREDELATALPDGFPTYRGRAGAALSDGLQVKATPSVFQVEEGIVVGKGVLRGVEDLERFIDAYDVADTARIARLNKEAMSHAG